LRRETLTFFHRDQYTAAEWVNGHLKAVRIIHCIDSIWDIIIGLVPEVDWWFIEEELINWFASIDEFHERYGIPYYLSVSRTIADEFAKLLSGYEDLLLEDDEYLKNLHCSPAA
jgi:hypothetical protein